MNANWAWTIANNLINEASYSSSKDQVFIDVFTETGLYKRSRTGVNYPYIYPGKEIEDKIPTINIDSFTTIDGGPYPSSSEGPIHLWTDTLTWVKGRHTMKAGVAVEYSGEDDFDQINVNSIPGGTNNQNGQFDFRNSSSARGRALASPTWRSGLFTNYAEIGERARTNWRALATDIFVQDSWRPTNDLTIEGGIRYALWEPWYSTTNNIANFDPRFYDKNNAAVINPATGRSSRARATTASSCPATASSARGTTWRSRATRPCRRSSAASRAASPRRTTTYSSPGWACPTRSIPRRSCAGAGAFSTTASR